MNMHSTHFRAVVLMILVCGLALAGCSSGRVYKTDNSRQPLLKYSTEDRAFIQRVIDKGGMGKSMEDRLVGTVRADGTVFVHPGLLFLVDWGGGRAVGAARALVKMGYARSMLEVRSRKSGPIYDQMKKETGTHFLGLHYSMGASPRVLSASLQAVERLSKETGKNLVYSPLMVEPFGVDEFSSFKWLDSPYMGNMIIVVSSEMSFLRPRMHNLPKRVLEHPKVHIVYAEDIGLHWSHFSFLSQARKDQSKLKPKQRRSLELFKALSAMLLLDLPPDTVEMVLNFYKIQYAVEDNRPLDVAWVQSLKSSYGKGFFVSQSE